MFKFDLDYLDYEIYYFRTSRFMKDFNLGEGF